MASSPKVRKSPYNTNCCVYGCHSRKGADKTIHFHSFPEKNSGIRVAITNAFGDEEKVDKRKAWEKVLLVGKPVGKYMRVCSKHFKPEDYFAKGVPMKQPKLKKYAVPSQNLPEKKSYHSNISNTSIAGSCSSQRRGERLARRQKMREEAAAARDILCENNENDMNIINDGATAQPSEPLISRTYDQLSQDEKVAVENLLSFGDIDKTIFCEKEIQVSSGDILITFTSTIKQDKHLNSLTGLHSFELLDSLTNLVKKAYPDKKTHKLSVKDRIILVFMKLKMALKLNVLSFLFKISPSWCKATFVEYVEYLSNVLQDCIYWPSFNECQDNMPLCFSNFKSVRVVLDCFEIPIEKPKCLCCRIRTYSHYKGKETIKFMTGVSPDGLITFVSKAYGGRTSDKAIFVQSNLINKLQPRQDSIMVDKGFLIDQVCNEHFIKLIRPHFLRKKKQFSESEAKENISISKARVHIERVNQRIRIFNILNTPLPTTFIPLIDNIVLIICGIVNLQNPILADNKF